MTDAGSLHSRYIVYLYMFEIFYHKMLKGRNGNITKKKKKKTRNTALTGRFFTLRHQGSPIQVSVNL